ncbi:MAG: tyrosine-type recombinase/integrase [Lachnospiraceae bacterium]|nr:tyrosine-type recombinase/integrase [Lachnospiraceae bacterium]
MLNYRKVIFWMKTITYEQFRKITEYLAKHVKGLDHFHFHLLRHTFTSNLLASGAPPKDVQELLGHLAVSTTMNICAHATRKAYK